MEDCGNKYLEINLSICENGRGEVSNIEIKSMFCYTQYEELTTHKG